ncbi:DUF2199 domain-containing protein [Rhizobium sp. LjRoot254]|uniref:DUF2199 domain-containing protein n=1 Tax=Rhizobium sp. LjRoot254 TaxID=3342297 RepID=UPI003F5067B1
MRFGSRGDCGGVTLFWKRRKTFSYTCSCCGEKMTGSPSFAMGGPPFIPDVPDEELAERVYQDYDLCHVRNTAEEISDEDIFAIRVMLKIPIQSIAEPFSWGVWVTQSRESFIRYVDAAGTDQRGICTFGWMPVTLASYTRTGANEPSEHLACDVHWQAEGLRPLITLHESDHPLYVDQRDGISWNKAVKIAQFQMALVHKPS